MKINIFDDHSAMNFEPISLTRPVFGIRYGAGTLLDRIQRMCSEDSLTLWTRQELRDLTNELYPPFNVNQKPTKDSIWLNGRVIWTRELIEELKNTPSTLFIQNDSLVGANLTRTESSEWLDSGGTNSIFHPKGKIQNMTGVPIVNYLWDFLSFIPDAVEESREIDYDFSIADSVVIDESQGSVVIDENVIVEPFTYLSGPLYIGKGSFIASHSKIKNSIIGPGCKVGGEVSGTIIQGNSNKVHDGYLGDSYLGEWVNLGAGTTNSNLKNNYTPVSMSVNGKEIDSDRLFLGSFIGDHTKTAIGTQLNTGTNIGIGCNVLAQSFPKRHIPSFTFCIRGKNRPIKFDNFITTAQQVKHRRNMELSRTEIKVLKTLFLSR